MTNHSTSGNSDKPRVLLATTAMLTFISSWQAAAVVLNDLGSSAFYAGGIAEQAIGPAAPWFILAVMLFAGAVCLMYMESCSMFVRGGVYRVVKEAMGGTLAKFSVSALMFDYVLTGPISGVSAGQYLVGFLNEILARANVHYVLPTNATSAMFAILVTIYFWWQNIKGIHESSEKAVRIMQFTTVMVVIMIGWCAYAIFQRGGHLPPLPRPANLHFSADAEGWLRGSRLPELIGLVGIMVAFGHSVLAMSGLETLAQVYREIEHPKLPNLKKTALVIFLYSTLFTSLVSFLAFAIIPNPKTRLSFKDNLIGGLAMSVPGPVFLRITFHAFVVVVGIMILAGAVNTAIVGSNGVLNRVSEDGVLTDWFRRPHPRYGTSHRIINLVVALQILTIVLSRGNIIVLGEAYAFGVIWSFAMKGLAVLVLRFTEPGTRGFRVPANIKVGWVEIPVGLSFVTVVLFATAITNLLTKEIATISGVAFTSCLFAVFTVSENLARRRRPDRGERDQFNLEAGEALTPTTVGVRPGNTLVLVRDYNALYPLSRVLERVNPARHDVVVLHIRLLMRGGAGEHPLLVDQLFSAMEQELFTKALSLAERAGKTIHLAVVSASEIWDGILKSAQAMQAHAVVLGHSPKLSAAEEARLAGDAWERLEEPKPQLALIIYSPAGREHVTYLGPHSPHLTPGEIDLLHKIWLRFSQELAPQELHHHDVVHFALNELMASLAAGKQQEVVEKLRQHLNEVRNRRHIP
jgi:amino acid transporter/nucleotide-binding universal stress UspA family protein